MLACATLLFKYHPACVLGHSRSSAVRRKCQQALSNSRAFQRFALKTHYHVEDAKTMASTGSDALKSSFENYAPKVKEFSQAFRDEVARDLKKMK
ncbi:hypothetical protein PC117_g13770 [Phytophthora cactorum]|uniref:Uncharacterized protein n=1 Tax=Phytophthora cactorum TaxID=29920 RepID=A0A8T1CZJ6_9STRA|nr:hypothetical protein PC117_g13770 [Phytophthora cactorum]